MAGLLGLDDDKRMALLTAAMGMLAGPGNAQIGRGGLLGIGAYQQAKRDRSDEQRQQMQEQLWQSQIAENQSQSEERRAKLAAAQAAAERQQKIMEGAPRVGMPTFNTGTPGYSSGVAQAYGVPEAKPADTKVDVYSQLAAKAAYLADNNDIANAEKYADLANKMKPKYSPTLTVVLDPATNKHILVQASETEMPRAVQGMLPERKVELKDFGGSLGAVDMRDLMPGSSFSKTMTPGERDTSARGWAQFNYTKTKDAAEAAAKAKLPAGGEKITESHGTAANYLAMMEQANKTFDKYRGNNSPWPSTVNMAKSPWLSPLIGVTSPEAQEVEAAQTQWTEAGLRITTGATAPPEEVIRMRRMMFPQPGDSSEVIKQKDGARAAFIASVRIKAGGAAPMVDKAISEIGGEVDFANLPKRK